MSLLRKVNRQDNGRINVHEKYGFKYNPFPNKTSISLFDPNPKNNGSIYVPDVRKSEINQFNRILIPSKTNHEPKQIAFLMDYATRKGRGIGKTSFLNYQRKKIQADFGDEISEGTEVIMAVLVSPSPDTNYKRFYSITKLIIESMIDQNLFENAYYRLKVFTDLIDSTIVAKAESEGIEKLSNAEWLKQEHLAIGITDYDDHSVGIRIKQNLIRKGVNNDLANTIAYFGFNSLFVRKYFFDKVNEIFWKQEGNELLFNDLAILFQEAGITKFIILFDELEKIVPNQNAAERRNFCDILRYYFMDGNCENSRSSFYHILFVIHPYLQELLIPHWEASGLQRFAALGGDLSENYTVLFESFNDNNSIPLAQAYLNDAQINNQVINSLSPFTEDALKEALKKTLGVPGKYLTLLHTAIEKGIELNWETIDIEQIKLVETPKIDNTSDDNDETPLTELKTDF
ncbi:MAG TPA: hypothetical protein VK151_19005 [Fluviicola sp.]|nr:hypothetical protein [Fluviicola sp.]